MMDIVLRIIGFIVWGFFAGLPFVVAPMIAILTSLAIMVAVRGIWRHIVALLARNARCARDSA